MSLWQKFIKPRHPSLAKFIKSRHAYLAICLVQTLLSGDSSSPDSHFWQIHQSPDMHLWHLHQCPDMHLWQKFIQSRYASLANLPSPDTHFWQFIKSSKTSLALFIKSRHLPLTILKVQSLISGFSSSPDTHIWQTSQFPQLLSILQSTPYTQCAFLRHHTACGLSRPANGWSEPGPGDLVSSLHQASALSLRSPAMPALGCCLYCSPGPVLRPHCPSHVHSFSGFDTFTHSASTSASIHLPF